MNDRSLPTLQREYCELRGVLVCSASAAQFHGCSSNPTTSGPVEPAAYRFSVAVRPPRTLPAALNGFGLWLGLMVALTIVNYGFPIAHSLATPGTAVPAVKVGERW